MSKRDELKRRKNVEKSWTNSLLTNCIKNYSLKSFNLRLISSIKLTSLWRFLHFLNINYSSTAYEFLSSAILIRNTATPPQWKTCEWQFHGDFGSGSGGGCETITELICAVVCSLDIYMQSYEGVLDQLAQSMRDNNMFPCLLCHQINACYVFRYQGDREKVWKRKKLSIFEAVSL